MKKLLVVIAALALLAGCSSEPAKQSEPAKPKEPETYTGRYAFQKLYVSARGWARDSQGYRIESLTTPISNGRDGKSALWHASFASPALRSVKTYTWSGGDFADAPRGINFGPEDTYNPNNASTLVFDIAFLKIDSDKALEVSKKHGGDKLLEKEPDTPIVYQVDWDRNNNQLVWHVIYGSASETKLKVAVDASTGDFIRVQK